MCCLHFTINQALECVYFQKNQEPGKLLFCCLLEEHMMITVYVSSSSNREIVKEGAGISITALAFFLFFFFLDGQTSGVVAAVCWRRGRGEF